MSILIKIKKWFNKNKKYVLISGTAIFTVGASIAYVIINGIATAFGVAIYWIFRYM